MLANRIRQRCRLHCGTVPAQSMSHGKNHGYNLCFVCFRVCEGGFSCSIQQYHIFSNIFKQWPRHLPLLGQGPLVFLKYFHQDLIKWCSMHTLNLGLCYSTNGGALMLCDKDWFQNMLPFFCCPMYFFWFHLVYVTVFIALVLIVF